MSFKVKSKVYLTCDMLMNLPIRKLKKFCKQNKNQVMEKCCATCKRAKVKIVGGNISITLL